VNLVTDHDRGMKTYSDIFYIEVGLCMLKRVMLMNVGGFGDCAVAICIT